VRFATIRTPDGTRAARVEDDTLVELDARDVGELLARAGDAPETGTRYDVAAADFAPVVTHPGKIICQGLNYRNHILEMGHELPTHPTLFAKFREALIGAHDDIVLPASSHAVDWEAELALVIGTRVRHASPTQAADAIAGFTVANDVSMRDWQHRSLEWLQGKTWERSTPVGPWLVTADELGGAEPDLEIRCEVDGAVRQASRTSELVFSSPELVAYASEFVTLEPGDLLLTGTPAGVGTACTRPPTWRRAKSSTRSLGSSGSSATPVAPRPPEPPEP
jgi:acylpyruvate hydrolase